MEEKDITRDYVLGKLSPTALSAFESRLKNDPQLQEKVVLYKNLYRVGKAEESEAFAAQLKSYDEKSKTSKQLYPVVKWAIAAILVLCLAVPSFLYFNKENSQTLFAQNFEPYRNVIMPIERNGETKNTIQHKAFVAYENKEFSKAITYFEQLPVSDTTSFSHFYIGNSKLALGNNLEATAAFTTYLSANGSLKGRAQWYLALSHLAEDNIDAATSILEKIVENKTYNHEKAVEILGKLK